MSFSVLTILFKRAHCLVCVIAGTVLVGSTLASAQPGSEPEIQANSADGHLLQALQGPDRKTAALWHFGMTVQTENGSYVVTSLLNDYPAELVGIRRGDKLLSLNGMPFQPTGVLTGAGATTLELEREGERLTLSPTPVFENLNDSRRSAFLNSIQEFSAGNKTIAYIHPWSLSRNLNDVLGFIRVIAELALSDGLILDLRNSYGYLSIQHLDSFLPSRRDLFELTGPGSVHTRLERDTSPLRDRPYGKPVAVLIDATTAGGAALLAYQLAKLDRVTTVGEAIDTSLLDYIFVAEPAPGRYEQLASPGAIDNQPLGTFHVEPKLLIPYPLSQSTRSDPQFEAAFNVLLGRI